ncbi:MAG: aldo/keto reductase [Pseudomonadales bacterium]
MERRPLGSTGLTVSLLGLGTVKLGRTTGLKHPRPFQLPDSAAARRLLDCARDLGINLLDTAPAYGRSEERVGKLLGGTRDAWVLCTKVGEEFDAGRSHFDFSASHTRQSVERSLRRLRTERIDVVLIHSNGADLDILDRGDTLATLMRLQERGLIGAVGMSHKTAAGGRRALELGCDVIMATLNLDDLSEQALIAEAAALGRGVLVKKALASGHAGVESLRFVAAQPGVSSVVVGTIDPGHLRANAAAVAGIDQPSP